MRLNKYIALNSYLSRRQADDAISAGRVSIDGRRALLGEEVTDENNVTLDNSPLIKDRVILTILLNKPVGYVCSRDGQGSPTVYTLIPRKYHHLNIAGRLDKDSSGLVVMTSDGELLYELTHPSKLKDKVYVVELNKQLSDRDLDLVLKGVEIDDKRPSKFKSIKKVGLKSYQVILNEGRNRQIRRTFEKLNYKVKSLHRNQVGQFSINKINSKNYTEI